MVEVLGTGVDLSKILGGQTKILGEKVIKCKCYKCMRVSKLLGARARAAPKVNAYVGRQI